MEEVILKTKDVSVRMIGLEPSDTGQWHFHTEVTDNMFCLTGTLSVFLKGPEEEVSLFPGQRCEVVKGRVHRVMNRSPEGVKYLLVQGVGSYDFNVVQ
jgi:quercetin dioxygenase-like cupin family protein